jgi:hypothetical protein
VPAPEKPINPLIITDATGDQVIFNYWPGRAGEAIGAPVTISVRRIKRADDPPGVPAALIVPDRTHEIIAWLRSTLSEDPIWELTEALRLTVEYAQLPNVEGWSWVEALKKYRPELDLDKVGVSRATIFRDSLGRPYTDEELGRGDSPRRNQIITDMLEAEVTEVEGRPAPQHGGHPATMDICMGTLDETGKCSDCGRVFT